MRVLVNHQTQGNNAARADGEAVAPMQPHLAVAAQANGIHLHGLHHRTPISNHGSVKTQRGFATTHHGNIGCRSAHVSHNRVLQTAECASAQHAGRRTGEHRADRALHRTGYVHQRAVAFDDHQRCIDRAISQGFLHGLNQCLDMKNHARVERNRECAPGRT